MFKTILAFIKAHTIATAITTTVVVSTVVATPIIINQVQKQPEQEIETGQVQENIIDNTVIDNTIEETTETPEENNVEENTTVPEEEQKVETPKEENKNQGTTKPTTPTSNTNTTTNNNKTEKPTENVPEGEVCGTYWDPYRNVNRVITFNEKNMVFFKISDDTTVAYDPTQKVWFNYPWRDPDFKEDFGKTYNIWKKNITENIQRGKQIDIDNCNYTKDYCQKKIAEYANEVYRYQGALEYLKLHENDIQSISNANNEFLYEGKYYSNYAGTLEGCIRVASKNKADWEQNLKTAPQYRTC